MSSSSSRSRPRSSSPEPQRSTSSNGTTTTPSSITNTSKRQRVAVACGSCRLRKSRCDGARPTCSTCAAMHFACAYTKPSYAYATQPATVYPPAYAQMAPGLQEQLQEQLAAIDARVAALAQAVFQNNQGVATTQDNPQSQQHQQQQNGQTGQSVSVSPDRCYVAIDDGVQETDADPAMMSEERNDGMEAIVFTEEEDAGFFGPFFHSPFSFLPLDLHMAPSLLILFVSPAPSLFF